jgi:hypothetical protein
MSGKSNTSSSRHNNDNGNNNNGCQCCCNDCWRQGCHQWCTLQRRWLNTKMISYIGYDVSGWSLSYLHSSGGHVRNDEFERYYYQRMGIATIVGAICWSIAMIVLMYVIIYS